MWIRKIILHMVQLNSFHEPNSSVYYSNILVPQSEAIMDNEFILIIIKITSDQLYIHDRKLDHYGVRGSTLKWIKAFLTHRSQQVTVEGATSDSVEVLSEVPKGTVLGSLLFLIFINDLPDCVKSKTRLFADDCILYRRIRNQCDCDILPDGLNSLASWEKKWYMAFHPEKCSATRVIQYPPTTLWRAILWTWKIPHGTLV